MNSFLKRLRLASALQVSAISLLLPGLALMPTPSWSNPTGGVVTHGVAEINAETLGHLKVFQQSNRAVINWESFNISAGEITEFIQPGADAVALSRVVGGNPSAIYGMLKANGGHILVNQNGILVGPGGVVDVGGLNVLSTLDVDDNEFMAGGPMRFVGSTAAGVTNFGTINSAAGDVILMGNFIENNGSIGALNGTVALAAGGEILLEQNGESTVSILRAGPGGETGVNNTGTITGAAVEMKAHGNVYALAVNNSGTIRATGASRVNGRVVLSATGDGTASGKIVNTGTIEANNADGSGGEIMIDAGVAGEAEIGGSVRADGIGDTPGGSVTVLGDIINVTDGALVSASGSEGGVVMIGSPESSSVNVAGTATLQANGSSGNAGVVTVAGQEVLAEGTFSATSEEGDGGEVNIAGADVSTAATTMINTSGFGRGGAVIIDAGDEANIEGGQILSNGQTIRGGDIGITGPNVNIGNDANIDAAGEAGGRIRIGGGFRGQDESIDNAENTTVEEGVQLDASATGDGNAGQVIVWADQDTYFGAAASSNAVAGNGGLIEISGLDTLTMRGSVSATSVEGRSGTVLFDPGDVSVGNNGTADIPNSIVNDTLQGGTSVLIFTESGDITFENTGINNDRHDAIQWTNSLASFGAFASGNIFVNTHIRTSGEGSINLISGWGGSESDFDVDGIFGGFYGAAATDDPAGGRLFEQVLQPIDPENVWEEYVENGQFGFNSGATFIGSPDMSRHVVVGSRFGNTNVAGAALLISASQGNTGESDYAHLGFRDSGQVFAVRGTNGYANATLDLNTPGNYSSGGRSPFQVDNDPVVGYMDYDAYAAYVADPNSNPGYFHDLNGDTVADGVYAINSSGILDEDNPATGGDPTMIPFANHFMSERFGNWWWQQIDGEAPDPKLLGGLAPEHGAGQSSTVRADINVVTTGPVLLNSGGRHQDYAQIGHGGDGTAWADDKSLYDSTIQNDRNISNEWARLYSYNSAQNDRSATTIARLAPIYGNINVLAGVDRSSVEYNPGALKQNLTGEVVSQGGFVTLESWQNTASTNNLNNPEQGNNSESYTQIGHLGTGQSGSVYGDINVKAGGDVTLLAGAHTRSHATIGHTMNGFLDWNLPENNGSQIRFFANGGDFQNPNLRKGELFLHENGIDAPRGFYAENTQSNRWDDDFYDTDGDVDNDGLLDSDDTTPVAVGSVKAPAANGAFHVPGFYGGTVKDIVGDIRVESSGQNGITIKGFTNPDTRTDTTDDNTTIGDLDNDGESARLDGTVDVDDRDGLNYRRDRRFAGIGHGGSNFDYWGSHDNERVRLRVSAGTSESVEQAGQDNASRIDRSQTFVNLIGDIEVTAHNGDITIQAGNDTHDYAYIGHGGADLADMETGNVIAGDITVYGAGDLLITGGGYVAPYTGGDARSILSHAIIGHHGFDVKLQGFFGDIDVDMGGDISLIGGRYRGTGAKIGHQSEQSRGQVGGEFERTENFVYNPQLDGAGIDLSASVTNDAVTITVDGETNVYEISGYTADVSVSAGGDILLDHSKPGLEETQNMYAGDTDTNFIDLRWSPTQIGHGGRVTSAFRNNLDNPAYFYKDKTGNITVNAGTATLDPDSGDLVVTGGDITMRNGEGLEWWTAIGHIFANGNRSGGPDTVEGSYNAIGDITINALGSLTLNADAAGSTDTINVITISGDPVQDNPVKIGHGGIFDNLDIQTLDDGTLVNGIAADSDIIINVGNDMTLKGGKGTRTSYAQVGHGYASNNGGDPARPSGFNGDITVNVGNDLVLEASHQAVVATPIAGEAIGIEAGLAAIGHGGHLLDADLSGDISVYVGNDLSIIAGDRNLAQGAPDNDPRLGYYEFLGRDSSGNPLGSIYNMAKIGHWSTELDALSGQGPVDGDMSGNVTVVVGNDLDMKGGQASSVAEDAIMPDQIERPVVLAYSQIGNGGPGVNGIKSGDITVLVGNDFTTVDGNAAPDGLTPNLNNYVMVGNGDWLRDGPSAPFPPAGGPGVRSGNISIAVGENASFDHTLIGHADRAVLPSLATIVDGDTFVGVSRNTPFYGGTGTLTAENGTVFSSGTYGFGGELRLYIPQRENNLMDDTTRMNEATATYRGAAAGGSSFQDDVNDFDRTRNGGVDAGDPDEIYLQPDLWWDHQYSNTAEGDPLPGPYLLDWRFEGYGTLQEYIQDTLDFSGLPTDGGGADDYFAIVNPQLGTDSLPNGQIAEVDAPGGLPNLVAMSAGFFGSGTAEYRGGNGLSGTGNYTVYYDAIRNVGLRPPLPPVIPPPVIIPPEPEPVPVVVPPPFNYFPFLFLDKYDSFDRDDQWLFGAGDNYLDGIGLISRIIGETEGEPGVGLAYESEALESLAELLGFPVDETDEAEEDEAREQDASSYQFIGSLHGIYWQYQPFQGEGRYSSNNLFGTIGL